MQFALFDAPASPTTKKPCRRTTTAKRSVTEYQNLRTTYAGLAQDWEANQFNLVAIEGLLREGERGNVDDRVMDGAILFGALDIELAWETRTDGRWPIRAHRWLRHLRFTYCRILHEEAITLDRLKARMLELSAAKGVAA